MYVFSRSYNHFERCSLSVLTEPEKDLVRTCGLCTPYYVPSRITRSWSYIA